MAELLAVEPVVLATVVTTKGSTPREVGAKMLITSQVQVGTIGGGAGEAKVFQQALEILATGHKQLVEINLLGALGQSEGICGGIMEVWIERWQGDEAIALIQEILTSLKAGQSITLLTPLVQNQAPYLFPAFPEPSENITPSSNTFREKISPPPTLLIVGAGHCGIALAKVAHFMGMKIIVVDDRPAFAHPDKFPPDTLVIVDVVDKILDQLKTLEHLYIALVTRNYEQDIAALRSLGNFLAGSSWQYLGIIGSIKRIKLVQQHLKTGGYNLQNFPHTYAPLGLDIGALTPEEIAVSICAEILKISRGGTGASLSIFRESIFRESIFKD